MESLITYSFFCKGMLVNECFFAIKKSSLVGVTGQTGVMGQPILRDRYSDMQDI